MRVNDSDFMVISSNSVGLETSAVLRKTYFLLGLTIMFSAVMALLPMFGLLPVMYNPILSVVGMFGLLYLVRANCFSEWGIFWTFAFTGFMGYSLVPTLMYYLSAFTNGPALVMMSLFCTALVFMALSLYAVYSGADFSYLGGMLFVGVTMALLLSIIGIFWTVEWFSVVVSGIFMLVVSGLILFRTNLIVNGGEQNYILATVSLYISILNLFLAILRILSFFAGSRRS